MEGKKIFIVDDEVSIRTVLLFLLEDTGADVYEFASSKEVLAAYEKDTPDIILCDLNMAGGGGVFVKTEVNKKDPDLPFLFITGEVGSKSEFIDESWRNVDWLEKPFEAQVLIEKIETLLK